MIDDNNTRKNNFNDSPKDAEYNLKSENMLLKESKVSVYNRNKQPEKEEEIQTNQILIKSYEESPSRYYILVSYCFCIFASGFQWLSFTSLPFFSIYYELSQWKIDFFSLIYMIEYIILFIPIILLLEKLSTKNMFRISSLCVLVGSFLKIFINKDKSLSVCYIGQIISGLGHPYLLMIPGKISADWFKENKRNLICTISFLSEISGILIGYIWNLAYIKKEENNKDDYKDHVYRYFLAEFILVLILCIPALFVEESSPEKPSSPSKEKKLSKFGKDTLKNLFNNFKYIIILISMFFIGGYYCIISMKFISFVGIYGLDKNKSDIVYSISITVGIVCSLIISFILDKYKKYKIIFIILSILSTISQIFLTFLLELVDSKELNAYTICIILYIFINVSVISFYSSIINYICEIIYPIVEYISIAFIILVIYIYNICGHFLYKYILEKNEKKYVCNIIFTIFFLISAVLSFFYENKLKRYEIDKNEENNQDNNIND